VMTDRPGAPFSRRCCANLGSRRDHKPEVNEAWRVFTCYYVVNGCMLLLLSSRTYEYPTHSIGRWSGAVVFPRCRRRERLHALL
jgi:hypothetical protein